MRRALVTGTVVALAALAVAPAAHATKSVSPTSYDFGALPIGTKSVERTFTLTATCNPSMDMVNPCQTFEAWDVQASVIGDFAIEGDNCPNPFLIGDNTMFSRSCEVRVTFTPTAYGPRNGTLITGGGGPNVPLTGSGPTLVVTQAVPVPAPGPSPAPTAAKKCKKPKKRAAVAAKKKCKKRRR
jgi:hypothetical protein